MTQSTHTPKRISCADIAPYLDEELKVDLSFETQEAIAQHLAICPECDAYRKLVVGLPSFPTGLSKDELNFAIHKVTARVRQSEEQKAPRKLRPMFALAAGILLAGCFSVIAAVYMSSAPSDDALSFQCEPTFPEELVSGVLMTHCGGQTPPTATVENGVVRVFMKNGAVGLSVDPERENKLPVVVETPRGAVRVKGTVFTVRGGVENMWVEVFRGVVEVVSRDGAASEIEVVAGHGVDVMSGSSVALNEPKTEMLRQRLMASALAVRRDAHGEEVAMDHVPLNHGSEPDIVGDSNGLQEPHSAMGRSANRPQRRRIREKKHVSDSMYDLIQGAQSCLIDRNWKCAADRYEDVLARYPKRRESLAVLISLAKVELRYMNAPQKALMHYKSYQRREPNGPLAEEALYGMAEAYRRLGRSESEKMTLIRFVERFPESALIQGAYSRLKHLEK